MLKKMVFRFTAALVLLSLVSCGAASAPQPVKAADESFEVIETDEFEGVIVPGTKASSFMKAFSGLEEKESWTPARADVIKLEDKIEDYLKQAAAKRSPNLWSKLKTYKRQYIGLVRNGHKVIYANFFCEAYGADWKAAPVSVEDGGDCFFNVIYNPHAESFSNLQVHGEA